MPQKKNPDIAELLRARPARALGSYTSLATTLKGLPLAYDRDLQEDKGAIFAAVDDIVQALEAATLLVRYLQFDRGRLAEAASDPALLATDAAEKAVREGMPFRHAHEAIGKAVREGTLKVPWDARRSVRKRSLPGGPSPRRVRASARSAVKQAAALRNWDKAHRPRLPL